MTGLHAANKKKVLKTAKEIDHLAAYPKRKSHFTDRVGHAGTSKTTHAQKEANAKISDVYKRKGFEIA
jgi:hypothetical protein